MYRGGIDDVVAERILDVVDDAILLLRPLCLGRLDGLPRVTVARHPRDDDYRQHREQHPHCRPRLHPAGTPRSSRSSHLRTDSIALLHDAFSFQCLPAAAPITSQKFPRVSV